MTWRDVAATLVPGIAAGDVRLLGEGVWGQVVDLGDGTVMKLVRSDGGLGDGLELWCNETSALAALADIPLPFTVPRPVGQGRIEPDGPAGKEGYLAWIRMTRIEGDALDDDLVETMSPARRERLGGELGRALASLHDLDPPSGFSDPRADLDSDYLFEIIGEISDIADPDMVGVLRRSLAELATGAGTVPNHGDINTTNILADGEGHLAGLIDWAEARRDWPEAEFCHLRCFPEFLAPVRAAYEARRNIRLDDRRLDLAALHNSLITVALARRSGDTEEEAWGRDWVARLKTSVLA